MCGCVGGGGSHDNACTGSWAGCIACRRGCFCPSAAHFHHFQSCWTWVAAAPAQVLKVNHTALEKRAQQAAQEGGEAVGAGAAGGGSLLTSFGWAVSSLGLGGSKKVRGWVPSDSASCAVRSISRRHGRPFSCAFYSACSA